MGSATHGADPIGMRGRPYQVEPHQAPRAIRSLERGGVIVVHRGSLPYVTQEGNPRAFSARDNRPTLM